MEKRRETMVWAGLILLIVAAFGVWMFRVFTLRQGPVLPVEPMDEVSLVSVMEISQAPADVRDAAERLKTSNVGYAMIKSDKTYLIIATGNGQPAVKVDKAETQPASGAPSQVDIFLKADPAGSHLIIATVNLTGNVDYLFNLGGDYSAVPTLFNRHHLPLVFLNEATSFSVTSPAPGALVEGQPLRVEGYARVFEAAFSAKLVTAKGRLLGESPVYAVAGAPNWGSFSIDLAFDTANLPDEATLILYDSQTGKKVEIPVKFKRAPQMG